jgi:hypothetical protein
LGTGDEAAICKFTELIEFYPSTAFLAGNAQGKIDLNTYISAQHSNGAGTFLYDAVYQSIDRAATGSTSKRAVVVLSDGVEDPTGGSPVHSLNEVIAYANQKGIPIFTIYFIDEVNYGVNYGKPDIMQRLASETGGQYFNALDADFNAIFQQISNVLSNKYTLNYTSSSTCTGTISVRADWNGLYGQDSRSIP